MLAHLRHNVIAYFALFVALSGTAIAATALPKNSVGKKQLKAGAVTRTKIKKNAVSGAQVKESTLAQVPSAATADKAKDADTIGGQAPAAFLAAGSKAVDADRLDGVDSTIFGSVQTYTGADFEPRDSTATTKVYDGTGSIHCGGTANDFHARVQLPQGARITKLEYRYVDDSAVVNNGLRLVGFDVFEVGGLSTVEVASAAEGRDSPDRFTTAATLTEPHVVDNAHYAYELVWSPVACNADSQIAGAAVHYSLPQ